jgi:hypothetical protein
VLRIFFSDPADEAAVKELKLAIESCDLRVLGCKRMKSDNHYFYEITLSGRKEEHNPPLARLLKSPMVKEMRR